MYRKREKLPTKLDLSSFKNQKPKGPTLGSVRKVQAEVVDEKAEKASLDVFVFAGKKHNAWQVLSVPLGAETSEIKSAYAHKVKADPARKGLYYKALKTLT